MTEPTGKYRYFEIYKPYGMLSQFTPEGGNPGLKELAFPFPPDVYPLGRLDSDSEGLLLLTNNPVINSLLLDPSRGHGRKYLVQVEGYISPEAVNQLRLGVNIKAKSKMFRTQAAKVEIIPIPELPERVPPIRFRKTVPTSWIEITLTEGKNRQVRKMTAAVGFPTLRLVRWSIGEINIYNLLPGEVKELDENIFFKLLKLSVPR